MKAKILLAEDDDALREIVIDYCTGKDHELCFLPVRTGNEAIRIAESETPDLYLLDVMMPGTDGFTVCKAIRRFSNAPVIFLTARVAEEDRLSGYDAGGDDYMIKPFLLSELLAKIYASIRRARGMNEHLCLTLDRICLNTRTHSLTIHDIPVTLTRLEYELLRYLLEHQGIPLSRNTLLQAVWGSEFDGYDRSVDKEITRLRRKLGDQAKHLITINGTGYQIGGTR